MSRRLLVLPVLIAFLAGCDQLGIQSADQIAAKVEADGKAVGGACRYSGRAIEDCFALNRKTDKAAIYAGWREMDDYMRENKIASVPPTLQPVPAHGVSDAAAADDGASAATTASAHADAAASGADGGRHAHGGKPPKAQDDASS